MRLGAATLDRLAPSVERFGYDRQAQATGIVHFGIGAFHRAHQAWYTDRAMDAGDRNWMIAGVSLRSADVAAQLNPQDGLYTVTERSASGSRTRLVGSVRGVLVARHAADAVVAAIASPETRIVSFTVTEKGYCRTPDGALDPILAEAGSFYPLLVKALARRQAWGLPGVTLLSCDNLADNGPVLGRLLGEYCAKHDPPLGDWIAETCRFPATMVDRIVPATTDEDRRKASADLGLDDQAAVMTEPFGQWVIEDRFVEGRPSWDKVGAQLVADVAPYELAKLRMLNGAHSALAYLGMERGHTFVHQAVADPALRLLIERLMRQEAATSFAADAAQDLDAYADALLARFANPSLNHRLLQIAMDGSQKLPQRWLATLISHQERGQPCPAILTALGAWLRHVGGAGHAVDDPLAERLRQACHGRDLPGAAAAVFGPAGVLAGTWLPRAEDYEFIAGAAI